MTVKTSISLTDSQEAFARGLVEEGRYSSLSAVLQQGLEMLRTETETKEAEIAALRALLEERAKGPFISMEESDREIDEMIANFRERDLMEESDREIDEMNATVDLLDDKPL